MLEWPCVIVNGFARVWGYQRGHMVGSAWKMEKREQMPGDLVPLICSQISRGKSINSHLCVNYSFQNSNSHPSAPEHRCSSVREGNCKNNARFKRKLMRHLRGFSQAVHKNRIVSRALTAVWLIHTPISIQLRRWWFTERCTSHGGQMQEQRLAPRANEG